MSVHSLKLYNYNNLMNCWLWYATKMLQILVEFDVKSKNSSMFLIINLAPIIERKAIKAKKLNHEKRSQKTRVFEKNHQPAKTGQSRQKIGLEIMSSIKETEKCNVF